MKNLTCIGFVALILAFTTQCAAPKKEENNAVESPASTLPQLTEAQKAEGWQLMFDGQTLTGWRFFKNKENNSWEVVDGTLHCKPFDAADKRADIMIDEDYANFELAFEWKIAAQGNSGVMYRVTEAFEEPYLSGPEYQIVDDIGYPGESKDVHHSGANYDMHAPVNAIVKPVGEWNSTKIIVNGNHVEHWLNGNKVVEYDLGSEDWKTRKANSKWNDAKGYGMEASGFIDFQDHGNEVWFRNIMVRELP
jgi:hypothetical protein